MPKKSIRTVPEALEPLTPFERRAGLLRPYFNHELRYSFNTLPPPNMTEFFGPGSSGKSTLIQGLDKHWRREGFHCFCPQEGAQAIRSIPREEPWYNLATGMYAYQQLITLWHSHQYDHVIFDRCIFDAMTWMYYWYRKGKLVKRDFLMLRDYFLHGARLMDLGILLTCDVAIAINRERRHEISRHLGNTTNPKSLRLITECNMEMFNEFSKLMPSKLVHIDTTALNEQELVQQASEAMLMQLEEKVSRLTKQKR